MSLQIKPYLDLVCAEQGGRPGSPEQLTEAVLIVLLKKTALECPQPVCVVHLRIKKMFSMNVPTTTNVSLT